MNPELEELLHRVEANPLGRVWPESPREALERRITWLGAIFPGSTRSERLGAALDDLTDEQRAELAEGITGEEADE
ncbi:hypothetical protein [Amycolatopsis sp. 195334CR]|uniref:hypothetical protein n=1 Tax=Amycolatopsis sp. 195334CR TaxID=2814588 RepID=UPI001A9050F9|nr:hypothetical protein [Amycolatopsis sp. 195334CR]MBN6037457.1 hypothetical protein [Amycolatopsis sp. 195334CR]